jgi:tripartite-type tricarboxylate transporter receptor subunit TctC
VWPPDGYTLLMVVATNTVNATLYTNLNFNFIRDIAPVASIAGTSYGMLVNQSFPVKTAPEFIAYAKTNPGKINMASAGSGSGPHARCFPAPRPTLASSSPTKPRNGRR